MARSFAVWQSMDGAKIIAQAIPFAPAVRTSSEFPTRLPKPQAVRAEVECALIQACGAECRHVLQEILCDGQRSLCKEHAREKNKSDHARQSPHDRLARGHIPSLDRVLVARDGQFVADLSLRCRQSLSL